MEASKAFVEIDHTHINKKQQLLCGDAFMSKKLKAEKRVITVLSDGLGSGVKANVLSTMTATMALNYMSKNYDLKKTAKAIMQTLPVCSVRKISYATFTIADIDHNGNVNLIEYGNPSALIFRDGHLIKPERQLFELVKTDQLHDKMYFSQFKAELNDRIVLMSDGVSQSGLGPRKYPFGWGENNVSAYVGDILSKHPSVSARYLSRLIADKALENDCQTPFDDISCGVISFREPRETLVISGPPIYRENDVEMGNIFKAFTGKKAICGGTTANIISRETKEKISVDLKIYDPGIPTISKMKGADLITEGSITLGKVLEILEKDISPESLAPHAAAQLLDLLLNSDKIHFLIGTKINEAHQDPNVPVELEIRRSLIKQIIRHLEEKHLKETVLRFI